jgi:chromosome segregation ATPase
MHLRNEISTLTGQVEELEALKTAAEAEAEALARKIRDTEEDTARVQADKTAAEHQLLDLQVRRRSRSRGRGGRVGRGAGRTGMLPVG